MNILNEYLTNFEKGITHAGVFHADEVLCTCFLKLINPNFQVNRVFNVPEENNLLVFDIGNGLYDHHQADAEIRENGIPYAAFGLIVRSFGHLLMSKEELEIFDTEFVQPIDSTDNGLDPNQFSSIISSFNPNWDEDTLSDDCFWQAVNYANLALKKAIENTKSKVRAIKIVEGYLNKSVNDIVVFDKVVPWQKVLVPSTAKFVVYPSNRGGYNAQVIPTTCGGMDSKIPFPVRWYGSSIEKLQKEIDSMTFCHKSGFLLACMTIEDAIKACEIALVEFNKVN